MLEINQIPPEFALPELDGTVRTLAEFRGRVLVINFWSAVCPWARRADGALGDYQADWDGRVALLPIASNANETPEELARVAAERRLPLVLRDADQEVADLYHAQTTPHFFVLDTSGILRYQGGLDDVTFRNRDPMQPYLKRAVRALLDGEDPEPAVTAPYGCMLVRFAEQE